MDTQVPQTPQLDVDAIVKTPPPSRKNPFFLGLFLVLFTLAIITAGYLLGMNNATPITPQSLPTPEPTHETTADWKTHMNTKHGFSLKVLPEMNNTFSENVNGEIVSLDTVYFYQGKETVCCGREGPNLTIAIFPISGNTKWTSEQANPSDARSTITIADTTVNKFSGLEGTRFSLQRNGFVYKFSISAANNQQESSFKDIYTMLSTFQFTDEKSTNNLITIIAQGGLCPDGTCQSERIITQDGILKTTNKTHQLTPQYIEYLTDIINTTDFDAINAKPFTGTCPTAYDGQEVMYTFFTSGGTKTVSSCKAAIDYELPIFKEISSMSKIYE